MDKYTYIYSTGILLLVSLYMEQAIKGLMYQNSPCCYERKLGWYMGIQHNRQGDSSFPVLSLTLVKSWGQHNVIGSREWQHENIAVLSLTQ